MNWDLLLVFDFHALTLFLVLTLLWIAGGPILALLVSVVVSNVTNEFMMHPTVRMFTVSSQVDTGGEGGEKSMTFVMREHFIDMCRGIFLIYGAVGLLVVPTFVLMYQSDIMKKAGSDGVPFNLFLTSLANLLVVGGVVLVSHVVAVMLRDRLYARFTANGQKQGVST